MKFILSTSTFLEVLDFYCCAVEVFTSKICAALVGSSYRRFVQSIGSTFKGQVVQGNSSTLEKENWFSRNVDKNYQRTLCTFAEERRPHTLPFKRQLYDTLKVNFVGFSYNFIGF
jgi:hypothetical protein